MDLYDFCLRWLNAWTGNEPESLISFYTADVLYRDPAHPEGIQGRRALLRYLEKLLQRNPDWKWELVELITTELGFVLKWKATIPVKNTIITEEGLDIVELTDNLISRNEVFFDRSALIGK